jgi:tripartite-type tricarboxylate transporter receptor subunit TctC
VIDRIYKALVRGAGSPEVKKRLTAQGVEVVTTTPMEFAKVIREELTQWASVVKAAGIKPN